MHFSGIICSWFSADFQLLLHSKVFELCHIFGGFTCYLLLTATLCVCMWKRLHSNYQLLDIQWNVNSDQIAVSSICLVFRVSGYNSCFLIYLCVCVCIYIYIYIYIYSFLALMITNLQHRTNKMQNIFLKFLSPTNAPFYYTYKMLKYTVKISRDCSYMFRSTWTITREPMPNLAKVTVLWR
jgi:hypothetical protein